MKNLNNTAGIIKLVRLELFRYYKQKHFLISYIGILIFSIIMLWLYNRSNLQVLKLGAKFLKIPPADLINGLHFAKINIEYTFFVLMPIFVCLSGGLIFGKEASKGLINEILLFQISRWNLLASKYIALLFIILADVFILILLSLVLGLIFYGTGPLLCYASGDVGIREPLLLLKLQGLCRIVSSGLLIWLSLSALSALVFMLSVIFRNSVSPSISGITFYFIGYLIGLQPASEPIKKYLLNDAMYKWKFLYYEEIPIRALGYGVLILGLYIAMSYLISFLIFIKRDIR